ncbi:hypothetical protein [Streptomyces sp. NPDC059538]|uniref:hypothetical protein n=1 Tax=Streptomyces sp. NPDC059538 TaxID=3346860 RepID=UPI0036B91232
MGDIDDALERADREFFMREPAKGLKARINFVMGKLETAKAVSHRGTQDAARGDHRPDRRCRAGAPAARGP